MAEAPKNFIPLNFELIMNPLNWFTVILMLLIAGFALHLLLPSLSGKAAPAPANAGTSGAN